MNIFLRRDFLPVLLLLVIVAMGVEIIYLIDQNHRLRAMIDDPTLFFNKTLQKNQTVPSIRAEGVNGEDVSLRYAPAEPYTLLMWFSPTCSSCQDNFGFWNEIYRRHDLNLLRLVGFCACNPDEGRDVVSGDSIEYPVLAVTERSLIDMYKGNLLPQTVLISPEGVIRGVWPGSLVERQKKEILSALMALKAIKPEGGDKQ